MKCLPLFLWTDNYHNVQPRQRDYPQTLNGAPKKENRAHSYVIKHFCVALLVVWVRVQNTITITEGHAGDLYNESFNLVKTLILQHICKYFLQNSTCIVYWIIGAS